MDTSRKETTTACLYLSEQLADKYLTGGEYLKYALTPADRHRLRKDGMVGYMTEAEGRARAAAMPVVAATKSSYGLVRKLAKRMVAGRLKGAVQDIAAANGVSSGSLYTTICEFKALKRKAREGAK